MSEHKPPDHWADLTEDQKRVILEMAEGRLWMEGLWGHLERFKTAGVVVMGAGVFVTWGWDFVTWVRDTIAHLAAGGGR